MVEYFKGKVISEIGPMCNIPKVLCNMLLVTVSEVLFRFDDLIIL